MQVEKKKLYFDYVIAGGGLPGICAAIAAARLGLKTALIHNRGYIGGNAGAEVLVAVNGATGTSEFNFFAREDGIIEEILLENLHRNPAGNRYIWDALLMDMIAREPNLSLFLNTTVYGARTDGGRIVSVSAVSSVAEEQYEFWAEIFTDDTGDGTLGYLAGSDYRTGREGKAEFGEQIAPDEPDDWVLPSTLIFMGKDTGRPVRYIAPEFAMDIHRTKLLSGRVIPPDNFANNQWYYELGGDKDQTRDYQEILAQHRAFVYGVWDYIKNSGKFPAENYDLEYVSSMPGKREWRRLMGDVILTEKDIVDQTQFEDVIAYGGWSIDLHALEGIYSDDIQNRHYVLNGIFRIPFRCCYSRNVENLLIASRCLSVSHVAHGSTRLIATLSMIGQAVGTAACLCSRHGISPRQLYEKKLPELQRLLTRNDHTVTGIPCQDPEDLARKANVRASSVKAYGSLEATEYFALKENAALVLPVRTGMDRMQIICRAKRACALSLCVYLPSNGESYDPHTLLCEKKVAVEAGERVVSIPLPELSALGDRYIFLEFEANPDLALGCRRPKLTVPALHEQCGKAPWQKQEQYGPYDMLGVVSLVRRRNTRDTTWDAQKRCRKEYFYRMLPQTFCFSFGNVSMYGAENVINGYKRPFGGVNLWASAERVEGEWLELSFSSPQPVKELVITFDSGLNRRYVNTRAHDFDVMPELVKDYDVALYRDGSWKRVAAIRGNYQRVNRIEIAESGFADALRICFHAANGVGCVRVYEVSAYAEGIS